jgi:hypothetical protein
MPTPSLLVFVHSVWQLEALFKLANRGGGGDEANDNESKSVILFMVFNPIKNKTPLIQINQEANMSPKDKDTVLFYIYLNASLTNRFLRQNPAYHTMHSCYRLISLIALSHVKKE